MSFNKNKKTKKNRTRKNRTTSQHHRHGNKQKWKFAVAVAAKKYNNTHSIKKSRLALKHQIFKNIHQLFGSNGERKFI